MPVSYTESQLRTASEAFGEVAASLPALLRSATDLIARDPMFGGSAVHTLDRIVEIDASTRAAAMECETLADQAAARADMIVQWRAEELAYREEMVAWNAEAAMAAQLVDPATGLAPGALTPEPDRPERPAVWADLEI